MKTGMNMNGSHPTMKIIKPCNSMRAPRFRASPRHGGAVRWLQMRLQALIRREGALSGTTGFIANNYEEEPFHYSHLFNIISWETLKPANHLLSERTVPVPRN